MRRSRSAEKLIQVNRMTDMLFRSQSGDTLSGIAKAHSLSVTRVRVLLRLAKNTPAVARAADIKRRYLAEN